MVQSPAAADTYKSRAYGVEINIFNCSPDLNCSDLLQAQLPLVTFGHLRHTNVRSITNNS